METRPAGIAPDEQADVFTAASQRVTRAFLLAQVAEAERFGIGDCLWVNQLCACAHRIDAALERQQEPSGPRLRLVE